MLAFIKGTVESAYIGKVHIEVGGVGFMVNTSQTTLRRIGEVGAQVRLYTHLYVREDEISLYGFDTQGELNAFRMLISVSGVGPKVALAVLSELPPSKFCMAVMNEDAKAISQAHGIGLKTAMKIVIELKDRMRKEMGAPPEPSRGAAVGPASASAVDEAVAALAVLGYSYIDSREGVDAAYAEGMGVEALVFEALKLMDRGR
ncbi:MAG: Holliday junction branch migration protein RuvA [Oscillospiraceae bacterium]|nr:Holliday junction branch migration protein RuvA [Oscillospiraceae bacterium]